jgi:hypothetical protein
MAASSNVVPRYQAESGFLGEVEPAYLFRGQREANTVAELLDEPGKRVRSSSELARIRPR